MEECYNALLGCVCEIFDGVSLPFRELAQRLDVEVEARAKQVTCLFDSEIMSLICAYITTVSLDVEVVTHDATQVDYCLFKSCRLTH